MLVQNVNNINVNFTSNGFLFFRIYFDKINWIRVIFQPNALKLI